METIIKVEKKYLKLNDIDNGKFYYITWKGAELFWAVDEDGKTVKFTRNEVKRLGGNPDRIEEVLELEGLNNCDLEIFSEDGLNFITSVELKEMKKKDIDIAEFKKVKFEIIA